MKARMWNGTGKIGLLWLLVILFAVSPSVGWAQLSLSNSTVETVQDQAITSNQTLTIFSGELVADTNLRVDTFVLRLNNLAGDLNDMDTFSASLGGSSSDTNIIDGQGPFRVQLNESFAPNQVKSYQIQIQAEDVVDNNDVFQVELDRIEYTIDPGGADTATTLPENPQDPLQTSNEITIKSLIEPYSDVESLPRVLASESERLPLVHMEFAGGDASISPSSNRTVIFDQIKFRVRELLGEIIPGTDNEDFNDFGEFDEFALVRSSEREFDRDNLEVISTLSTEDLPTDAGQDSYVISGLAPSGSEDSDFLSETTDNSHYFITVRTNEGWGTFPNETEDFAQAFGFGDAWDAFVDTGGIVIRDTVSGETVTNQAIGDTTVDMTGKAIYNSFFGRVPPNPTAIGPFAVSTEDTPALVDKFSGSPTVLQNDNTGLDFFPNVLFQFTILGPAQSGNEPAELTDITVNFKDTGGPFDPCDDLKDLSDDKFSGLSVWKQDGNLDTLDHSDELLPLLKDDSKLCENNSDSAVLKIRNPSKAELPAPGDVVDNPDEDMTAGVGLGGVDDLNTTFYVAALMDKNSPRTAPDSFVASIELGGVGFSDGNSVEDSDTFGSINPSNNLQTLRNQIPIHTDTGAQLANPVRVRFTQTTSDTQKIGAPSDPTSIIGLNTVAPDTSSDWQLNQVDVQFVKQSGNFSKDDLNNLMNSTGSGVAIYQDDNSDPANKVGTFQPGIDDRLDLNLGLSTKSKTEGNGRTDPVARLIMSGDPQIPKTDAGDSLGADYFIVLNTSEDADNGDQFIPALGNAELGDNVGPILEFDEAGGMDTTAVFIRGNNTETDRFFADEITISTITSLSIQSITGPNPKISASGDPLGVLGINATDSEPEDQTLDKITTTFNFFANSDTTDIKSLSEDDNSGVALYRDKGNRDQFDPDQDEFIPVNNPSWNDFGETATVDLIPKQDLEVPDRADSLDDYFIAVRASDSIDFGDTFSVSIRGGDLQFSIERSPEDLGDTTPIIESSLPIVINDRTNSPRQKLSDRQERIDVLGINASDQNTGENLDRITVNLNDVNGFSCTKDLEDLSTTASSGVSIWADDGDGEFDPSDDTFLSPGSAPDCGGDLIFDFTGSSIPIPDTLDSNDDFFVVVRTSSNIQHGDEFRVTIPSEGVETSDFESGKAKTTNPLVFGSSNLVNVEISDTELLSKSLDVEVTANNQDTVQLGLEVDGSVGLPPDQYDTAAVAEPVAPGVFEFNDVEVSVSAETIGLVARGFNDTGPTGYSDKAIFTRSSLAGIDLDGRSNTELADALAGDEDFGIVVFGRKGGSNNNTSDPAFDPSNGETLKIIPPTNSTITMEIFDLQQKMVYSTSTSTPGRPATWDGEGIDVSEVDNGVYIVKVNSGSEQKTFPVVVLR